MGVRRLGPYQVTELLLGRESGNRPGIPLRPKGIVSHRTGDPGATARQVRDYFNTRRPGRESSAHYVVDGREIVRCVPEDEVAYHAGPRANGSTIGIELCEPLVAEAYERYVWLHADVCRRHGFGVEAIKPHSFYDPVNRPADPGGLFPWEGFLADVAEQLDLLRGRVRLVVEGRELATDPPPPRLEGDRVVAPVRDLAEALGFAVRWDGEGPAVHVEPVRVEVVVDGRPLAGEPAPRLANGRTLVPLRALAEMLGWELSWDPAQRRVAVRTGR